MKIQHLSYPFNHTIIYDYYKVPEMESMINEFMGIHNSTENFVPDTPHHENLFSEGKTKAYSIDKIYGENREDSKIITHSRKLFNIFDETDLQNNIFLNYIPYTNRDTLYVQLYDNGSSYEKHADISILTALYIFWLEPPSGGEFVFNDYNYKPHLLHNSCLIFPSFLYHEVLPVNAKRISMTHQLYLG